MHVTPMLKKQHKKAKLYIKVKQRFNLLELTELCFFLGIDHENFSSQKEKFAMDLITYLERRDRLKELKQIIKK